MAIKFACQSCGRALRARDEFAGKRAECPFCGAMSLVPQGAPEPIQAELVTPPPVATTEIRQFFDAPASTPKDERPKTAISLRPMFEALLDPRSIQWMLTLGGGLSVLGLIVWLTSWGVFENKLVLAAALGIGSLAILAAGWWVSLKTRFRIAGQALTFLGCIVAPLNLWFYAHVDLVSLDDHLWIGGLVCCLLYAATVYVLRDALFIYAVEAGATLTLTLLLAEFGKASDTSCLALMLMALGLISLHVERAFPPTGEPFSRRQFGLPFFWSGHAQVGVSLLILLGTQIVGWLAGLYGTETVGWLAGLCGSDRLLNIDWPGNWLTQEFWLAGGLWLAGVYAYLYSDLVVRRVGVYTCLAAFCVVMGEATIAGRFLAAEGWIGTLAVTALGVNLAQIFVAKTNEKVGRVLPSLAMVLGVLPILIGLLLHIRATSGLAVDLHWGGRTFVLVMLLVAVCNRMSAHLFQDTSPRWSAVNLFASAAALLIAAAGLLRVLHLTHWTQQAPWLMLVPIAYLVAARLWRGSAVERPLGWVAHAAAAVILFHVLVACLKFAKQAILPLQESTDNLILGLVFAEAAVFYILAAIFRRRSANVYFATMAACGALWQFLGYYGIPAPYYTMLYAGLGVGCLGLSRLLGIERILMYQALTGAKGLATRGRGLAAFQMGNAILLIASSSAILQGLNRIAAGTYERRDLWVLVATTLAGFAAVSLSPNGLWRRLYVVLTIALAGVTFLTLNLLLHLSPWQKLEIFCVAVGVLLVGSSYVGRFREATGKASDLVTAGLWLGGLLATVPLVIAVVYHRFIGPADLRFSALDELALFGVTVALLVTGYSWQVKSTTFFGGTSLTLYLIIIVVSLGWQQQLAAGVYLAVGGAVLFALGIVLSMYREKLLQLPEQIAKREGVFRILNWR